VQTFENQTSVVGIRNVPQGEKTVAFRADMDALAIQEETGLPYQSQNPGVMHACGHDSHVAVQLAFAEILADHPEWQKSNVKLIFQAAEEKAPGGAKPLCEAGVMEDVNQIFAFHCAALVPVGTICTTMGPTSANSVTFDVVIHGKGGHICMTDMLHNPLPVACGIVDEIQKLQHSAASEGEAVIALTYLNCGKRENRIPSDASLGGSLRSFDNHLADRLLQQLEELCKNIAEQQGCACEFSAQKGYPAAVNTKKETECVNAAVAQLGYERWNTQPAMNGEDFAYYLMEEPGSIYYVGMATEHPEPHHNSRFQLSPDGIQIALEMELAVYFAAIRENN